MDLALQEIYQKERGRLLGFIRKKVDSYEDAEDILQDVFISTLRGYSVTQPIENIMGWIYISARNRIIDYYRKRKGPKVSLDESDESLSMKHVLKHTGMDPDREFDRNLIMETVMASLDDLPEAQRNVFIWHELEGQSFKEIAALTGEPVNTWISRKRYAVLFLRERLKEIKTSLDEWQ